MLLPPVALGQEGGFGLDLTDDSAAEETTSEDVPTPASPVTSSQSRRAAPTRESLLEGERDVTVEDRVKSVQRKLYLKKSRFELSPSVSYAVNDPYYTKYGVAVRGAYYLQDTLAVAARFTLMQVNPNDDVRTAKRTFQSQIFYSVPHWAAMAGVEWSPIYGKVGIWNDILHFDAYVVGGLGVVNTETSSLPNRGLNPAMDAGVGVRFVAKDYLAVNAALINTSYVDAPNGTTKSSTQNVMMLHTGISLFFPFRSTNQEAQ